MAFAFMDIQKIKSEGQMTAKYNHNCRKIDIDNVISELSENNEDLIALPHRDGKELNYYEAFKERLSELPYYQNHSIRKDNVLAYEVLLTFSKDESIDIDEWKRLSVKWLKDTFDVAPDGKSNILHVAYHADETGNVHCHAIVTPIDENGKLNAKRFTGGSRVMSKLQDSYAESVAVLGLERGLAGSSAKHREIRRMYAELNRVCVAPEVKFGETAEEYRERVEDDLKTRYAVAKKQIDEQKANTRRKLDEEAVRERAAIQDEFNKTRMIVEREIQKLNEQRKELKKGVVSYEDMIADLAKQYNDLQEEIRLSKEAKEKIEFYDKFQAGINAVALSSEDEALIIQNDIDYVMNAAEEYEELYEANEEDITY